MITKDTPFLIALEIALGKIDGVPAYLMDIKSSLRYIELAANHFGYQNLPIYDIYTDHISNLLEYCRNSESKIAWSNKRSNKVKGMLGGLFRYESHHFDFEIFKNSSDTNIQLLVKLIETVDTTFHFIKNINSIQLDE